MPTSGTEGREARPASRAVLIDDQEVEVPGGRLFVRHWRPAAMTTSEPIVLLHDSLGCVDLWRDFPEALARASARPVAAYDRLGFGRSSPRSQRPSLRFIAEEAEICFPALRAALGWDGYALFGHSVGGAMALSIAAAWPHACRAVISESAQAFVEDRTLAGIAAAQAKFAQPGQRDKLVRWHGDKAAWVLDAWTGVWQSPAFAAWELQPVLAQVRCPCLILHGDGDEFGSNAFPRRIAAGISGPVQMRLLERCGHVPHREQPELILDLVTRFLGNPQPGSPNAVEPST